MVRGETDTRAVTLVDIPLLMRLTDKATVLDSEIDCTRDAYGPNGTVLTNLLLQRNIFTLVSRSDKQQVIAQFRIRADEQNAQIVYIAPGLEYAEDDTVWLHILDAMAREAGKHNLHALIAEVDEDCVLFETLRTAGYAVYARQQIWRRAPGTYPLVEPVVQMTEAASSDMPSVQSLIANTVPPLMHQISNPPSELPGWIYRKDDKTEAFIAVSEGKNGVYMLPYVHEDIYRDAAAVFDGVMRQVSKTAKVPTYVCVRRYQEWMGSALESLGFEPGPRQAVMVKHIAAGVRHATFKTVTQGMPVVVGHGIKPPHRYDVMQR